LRFSKTGNKACKMVLNKSLLHVCGRLLFAGLLPKGKLGNLPEVKGYLFDVKRCLLEVNSRLPDLNGRMFDLHGGLLEVKGRLPDINGRMFDVHGRLLDLNGRLLDINGRMFDFHGRLLYLNGRLLDLNGRMFDMNGLMLYLFYAKMALLMPGECGRLHCGRQDGGGWKISNKRATASSR
jgi:hypothetical protein